MEKKDRIWLPAATAAAPWLARGGRGSPAYKAVRVQNTSVWCSKLSTVTPIYKHSVFILEHVEIRFHAWNSNTRQNFPCDSRSRQWLRWMGISFAMHRREYTDWYVCYCSQQMRYVVELCKVFFWPLCLIAKVSTRGMVLKCKLSCFPRSFVHLDVNNVVLAWFPLGFWQSKFEVYLLQFLTQSSPALS